MTVDAVEADVCVIGAGFAGLTAARRLAGAGKSVLVLEARDRVGGRTWTEDRAGCPVDRGGAWLAPGHDAAFRLAAEVGVTTYKTYVAGHHLLVGGDKMRRYKGLIPRISPLAVAQIALTQLRLDRMAKRVPVEAPWSAPRAAEWDTMSMAEWLDRHRIRSKVGDDLFQMAARGLFAAEDPHDVSFLHLLFLIRAHHTIEALFSIEGGAQENLVHGGMGAFAERVAADLGGVVRLQSPVRSVVQSGDRVVVDTARLGHGSIRGRRHPARAGPGDRLRSGAPRRAEDALPPCHRRRRDQERARLRQAVLAGRRLQWPERRCRVAG